MLLQNSSKFGQALQNVFAILFLIIFPLLMAFLKAIKCFDRTSVSVSKVIQAKIHHGDSGSRSKTPVFSLKE